MEDSLKITIETYNDVVQEYINNTRDRWPQVEFEAFCQKVVPQGVILDVGCGWGRDCKAFVKQGFSVIGIDLSTEMIRQASSFAPTCTFILADLRAIPCEDHSFDGIWCCASLLHIKRSQVGRALSEFRRVLKADAPCCIIVKEGFGEAMVEYSNGKLRFFTYFRKEELRDQCLAAGFRVLEARVRSRTSSPRSSGHTQNWIYLLIKK